MGAKKKQTGALIDADLYRRLKSLAVLRQRRVGDLIDDAIRAYLAKAPRAEEGAQADSGGGDGQPL